MRKAPYFARRDAKLRSPASAYLGGCLDQNLERRDAALPGGLLAPHNALRIYRVEVDHVREGDRLV